MKLKVYSQTLTVVARGEVFKVVLSKVVILIRWGFFCCLLIKVYNRTRLSQKEHMMLTDGARREVFINRLILNN